MKIKTLRNVVLGTGCLMLALTLALNLMSLSASSKSIQTMDDSPYGMVKSVHSIMHIDEEMPFGMTKVNHVIQLKGANCI